MDLLATMLLTLVYFVLALGTVFLTTSIIYSWWSLRKNELKALQDIAAAIRESKKIDGL